MDEVSRLKKKQTIRDTPVMIKIDTFIDPSERKEPEKPQNLVESIM